MKIHASKKRWFAAAVMAFILCIGATACAQTYRFGDEADEIATIQTALKQLKLYSAEITGHFGEKTEAAVKKFQKKYALKDDGIVGEDTLKELYAAAGITSSGSSESSTLLRYGSQNDAVRILQENLTNLGYYDGSITGHFGSITEAAVMNFQRRNGLSADGIAGAKTLEKIDEALGKASSSSSSSNSSSDGSSSETLLKYGMEGSEAVRTLQQNLKTLGYYTGSVTGNFGRLTKDAVFRFQRANDLSADGIAGEKTLAAISSRISGSGSGSSSSSGSSSGSGSSGSSSGGSSSMTLDTSVTLQKDSKNDEVLKLQNMLAALGYYSGNKTGNFGDLTQEAVMTYQRAKGLTADGIAGKKTLAAINADYAGGSGSSGSGSGSSSSGSSNISSTAGNVIYSNFYSWRRNYDNGEYCTVYDFSTGYSWRLRIMTKDAHMDAEPVTAEDTAIMNKAFGNVQTWTPKAVWVTFSDGKTYIGSTHNVPHSPYHLTDNNFKGHLCVHFPIPMEKAQEIGPYATSHQEAINEGWENTQKLKY